MGIFALFKIFTGYVEYSLCEIFEHFLDSFFVSVNILEVNYYDTFSENLPLNANFECFKHYDRLANASVAF